MRSHFERVAMILGTVLSNGIHDMHEGPLYLSLLDGYFRLRVA